MFTGLVEEVGTIAAMSPVNEGVRVAIRASIVREGLAIGDSVAINGACLTAVELHPDGFVVDVVAETLRRTTLVDAQPGDPVNLERAVALGARLGGHMVQGHIDGTGTVVSASPAGDGLTFRVDAPGALMRYVIEKGSIAVDGVSLTVAARDVTGFTVALIPHTIATTTLGLGRVGGRVNLEVDLVAKYIEALVAPYQVPREAQ
jgi:riboflavin synthase